MSLIGTLNLSKSSLSASQAALQTTGNNIANVGNADYTRQVVSTTPNRDRELRPGVFLGTGVDLTGVSRQIDEALEHRLRASVGDTAFTDARGTWLERVESVFNELSDDDLSTRMTAFFNSWSDLANRPQDNGLRQIVLQSGVTLAGHVRDTFTRFEGLHGDARRRTEALATQADSLASEIADLNRTIVVNEGGRGEANGLRDQRDAAIKRLAGMVDLTARPQPGGATDVYVGSTPVVTGAQSRGITLRDETVDGRAVAVLVTRGDGGTLRARSGELAALARVTSRIGTVLDDLDGLVGDLTNAVNRLHASGQGLGTSEAVRATELIRDPAAPLGEAGWRHPPASGSFVVHVHDPATGQTASTLVNVTANGGAGDTSLNDLAGDLDAVADLAASVDGGRLVLRPSHPNLQVRFSQDNSGVLASLGVNGFFAGSGARDLHVNPYLADRPDLVAAAKNGQPGDNQTARAIADLLDSPAAGRHGLSAAEAYEAIVNGVATEAAAARNDAASARSIADALAAQREAISGVSLDEESVNLLRHQRAFQGASRVIAAIDELLRGVIALV